MSPTLPIHEYDVDFVSYEPESVYYEEALEVESDVLETLLINVKQPCLPKHPSTR